MFTLFSRLRTLISANVNYLLDRLEDPERLLRQATFELDSAITAASTTLAQAQEAQQLLSNQLDHLDERIATHHQQALAALDQGDEQRALNALESKQYIEQARVQLVSDLTTARETYALLKQQRDRLEQRRDELERQRTLLLTRQRAAEAGYQIQQTLQEIEGEQRTGSALRNLQQQAEQAEDRQAALNELLDDSDILHQQIKDEQLERALEALKQEQRDSPHPLSDGEKP